MSKRLEYKDVLKTCLEKDLVWLDNREYTSNRIKYKCQCKKCGIIKYRTFESIKKSYCECSIPRKKTKYTTEEVKQIFLKRGFIWIDKREYKNNNIKYKCKCLKCNKIIYKTLNSNKGCSSKICCSTYNYTTEEVKQIFLENNYEWLDNREYENNKIDYKCKCLKCNNIVFKKLNYIKHRCLFCKQIKLTKENHPNWIEDRQIFTTNKKLRNKLRSVLHRYLKIINENKKDYTEELLGYTFNEFKEHLYSFNNFETLFNENDLHIDHIIPISILIKLNIMDPKIVNSLYNLQPLSKKENLSKGIKCSKNNLYKFLEHFNIKVDENQIKQLNLKE